MIRLVLRMDAPTSTSWSGFKFISPRTLLLWTAHGQTDCYYLGPEEDLKWATQPSQVPEDANVVLSNGDTVVYTPELKQGISQSYRKAVHLARFPSPDPSRLWCTVYVPMDPSLSRSAQQLICFDASSGKENPTGRVAVFVFWANRLGSEILGQNKDLQHLSPVSLQLPPPVSSSTALFEKENGGMSMTFTQPSHWIHMFENMPLLGYDQVTSIAFVLKKYLAVGMTTGVVHILPFSTFMTPSSSLLNSQKSEEGAIRTLETHDTSVTCLFATDYRQSEKDRLLLGGTSDGWVYMWDLEYVFPSSKL